MNDTTIRSAAESAAKTEAAGLLNWVKTQFLSVASAHKVVTGVIFACGFVAGCIIH
jgi:hypothetical protein